MYFRKNRLISAFSSLFISLLFAASCKMGDDYSRNKDLVPKDYKYLNDIIKKDEAKSIYGNDMSRWWENLNDPIIESLVDKLTKQNLELTQATERVMQARERLGLQTGNYFPFIEFNGNASRSFSPLRNLNNEVIPQRIFFNSYSPEISVSWQIDLFGKLRRSVESAEALYKANIFDREALIHSLIADMVNKRVAIATNLKLVEISEKTAENRNILYKIVKRRYENGASQTAISDVLLAEENYLSSKSDISEYKSILASEKFSLDVLLGEKPQNLNADLKGFELKDKMPDVPLCQPAKLLDRRPDIRANELRLKAANADIGVAIADLLPNLAIGANTGLNSNEFSEIVDINKLTGSIFANLTSKIFEGGRLRSNIRLEKAEAKELAASYAQNILDALKEVETALSNEIYLKEQVDNLKKSVDLLLIANKSSEERYISGIIDLQEYLDIQQRYYTSQISLALQRQKLWNNRVSLYLALGGDWFNDVGEKEFGVESSYDDCNPNIKI